MLCVELIFDFVQFGSSPGLNALIENYARHSHCRYQTVYVFERHGDVIVILRELTETIGKSLLRTLILFKKNETKVF
jgi:hypothetical protein